MTKKLFALAILLFVFAVGTLPAATVLTFQSHPTSLNTATSQVMTSAGPAIGLVPNPAWYTPGGTVWVSPWPSGDPSLPGFFSPANGTTVTFTHDFYLPSHFVVTAATLTVLADDTTTGMLNGNPLFPAGTVQLTNCTNTPGCIQATQWIGNVTPLLFHSGWNQLSFTAEQKFGQSFGALWDLDVTGNHVPEPGTAVLLGSALFLIGLGRFRKFRRI